MIRCMLLLSLLFGVVVRSNATDEIDIRTARVGAPEFNRRSLIRGGEDVPNRVPWFVHFGDNNLCGGALVHEDIVVTTASCVDRERAPTRVTVGSKDRYEGAVLTVTGVRIHPDWRGDVVAGNDVAVLKLGQQIGNTLAVVNKDGNITETAKFAALGFGLLDNKELPKGLQQLFYDYVPLCEERFELYNPTAHLCADATPSRGACAGDTGGPVVYEGTSTLVGLISFSDGDCESQTYNVFTRMSTYQPFVQNAICDLAESKPFPECDSAPCLFFSWANLQRFLQSIQQFLGF